MDKRKIEESIFKVLMIISAITIIVSLGLILGSILYKGLPSLSWEMISQTPKGGYYLGKEGGILNAIVGSVLLAFGATILAAIISFPIVIFINVYNRQNRWLANIIRLTFDILWGIPSIVYGAFGFTIMIFFGIKTSLLAGIVIVSLVVLPVIARAIDEVIKMIPQGLFDASYALGATRLETSLKVIARQASPGILTALLIAFGRAIGDAAAVLFTAGYTDYIPTSIFQSVATLPLAIFFQLGTPFPEVQARGYASALILTLVILVISIVARLLTRKYKKFKI
ncbi:MAG: phosphate ABC transporter permease PstA [Bacteroidetes bacterium]|nr:phosphate ABC transporter permease PstA [Bacteroidota bacterium]